MSAFATVELLEKHLATRSYITGYCLCADDKKELANLCCVPCKKSFPNTWRWATHIVALTGHSFCNKNACSAAKSSSAPAKAAAADDDFDMGFDDDEDDMERNEEGENAAEAAATAVHKPVENSLVVLEVKPWEADTDLEKVWHLIKEYVKEGVVWGETFKLEPVAYGIKKLVMTCTIVDSLVHLGDATENIDNLEDFVICLLDFFHINGDVKVIVL